MLSLLTLGYLIAAFVAGIIALAMPCCFSVLLPSYFGQSFKQMSRLLGMTVIFSTGIATVMLPLAFGITFVGRLFGTNHVFIFVAGGFLMILIGFWTLWGRGMLPRINYPINLTKVPTVGSVYALGIFSGAATSCCAPVLAGILIFAALSANLLEGLLIGFTYVAGMVFPLFIIAIAWDKYQARGTNPLQGRTVHLKCVGRDFSAHSSKLIAGLIFLVMGVVNIWVGLTGTMIPAPGAILIVGFQAQFQKALLTTFSSLSLTLATLIGITALVFMIFLIIANRVWRGRSVQQAIFHS